METIIRFAYMAAPTPSPGQTLGHFRLIEQIAAGGMGCVPRCDQRLERDVAVKVLNAKTLSDVGAQTRFRREALILSRLNHPNVEAVYDFHAEQGLDYLVLEYVPGASLDDRLRGGPLAEREVVSWGCSLPEDWPPLTREASFIATLSPAICGLPRSTCSRFWISDWPNFLERLTKGPYRGRDRDHGGP